MNDFILINIFCFLIVAWTISLIWITYMCTKIMRGINEIKEVKE